jgi:hypothetical protein
MRDYKCRGRRKDNGEWVYGYYFTTPLTDEDSGAPPEAGWFFLTGETRHCIAQDGAVFVVDPSTVGQFTGLKDKNGVEIYEGDILLRRNRRYTTIVFDQGSFETQGSGGLCPLRYIELVNSQTLDALVVGNIHDNPELLKGGEPRG